MYISFGFPDLSEDTEGTIHTLDDHSSATVTDAKATVEREKGV
jgi:hypothetical protein